MCKIDTLICKINTLICKCYTLICKIHTLICKIYTLICKIYTLICKLYTLICKIYTLICKIYTLICKIHTLICKFWIGPGPAGHNFERGHLRTIVTKFGFNWPSSFRWEDLWMKILRRTDDGRKAMAKYQLGYSQVS